MKQTSVLFIALFTSLMALAQHKLSVVVAGVKSSDGMINVGSIYGQ